MTLVLFDIDGTLIRTGGAGGRAMARAARVLFAPSSTAGSISVAGRTDSWIVAQVAARAGHPFHPEVLSTFRDLYVQYLGEELECPSLLRRILPGVTETLMMLTARDDVETGLLTGNFQRAAQMKLEHFGLWPYFRSGAFGDDGLERNALLGVALTRFEADAGRAVAPAEVIVVGDTPLDVEVALTGGARAVAVATGPFDVDALRASGAHAVLSDFMDRELVLRALSLPSR